MKKLLIAVLIPLAINSYSFNSYALSPAPIKVKQALDVAPDNGFGGFNSATKRGTTGGSKAKKEMIFLVNNKKDLLDAIKINKNQPRIIQISGVIDVSENKPYKNFEDQKSRSLIKIPSNTTLIGVGDDAGFINGSIILSNVENIIIRNLKIEAPIDVAPKFEEGDGWNAEWDGINIISSSYVWVDHVTFTDGKFTDDMYQEKDGWKYVQHDGLLDIKSGSDLITISYCLFENHDKTMLIGHSDKNAEQDENKLNITLHHNVFSDILGYRGSVISENNQFMIDGLKDHCKVAKQFKGNNLLDRKSLFNESKLKLSSCDFDDNLNWSVPYQYNLDDIKQFSNNYNQLVGNGKL